MGFTSAAELDLVAGTAIGAVYPKHAARSLMRDRGGAVLVDQRASSEAVESEGRSKFMGLALRKGMGKYETGPRDRLETAGTPATIKE